MNINHNWRNKQLVDNFAQQELLCLNFMEKHKHLVWRWYGTNGYLHDYCKKHFVFSELCTSGIIIVNHPLRQTPKNFIQFINDTITDDVRAMYIAVNRFEFRPDTDLTDQWPEPLDECIDLIMSYCRLPLKRLYKHPSPDGYHFVGIHGLDIFIYENNQ